MPRRSGDGPAPRVAPGLGRPLPVAVAVFSERALEGGGPTTLKEHFDQYNLCVSAPALLRAVSDGTARTLVVIASGQNKRQWSNAIFKLLWRCVANKCAVVVVGKLHHPLWDNFGLIQCVKFQKLFNGVADDCAL